VNKHEPQSDIRTATLFRDEDGQAVRIPAEFELEAAEVTIRKEGGRLVIEPKARPSLREFLDSIEPVDMDWPDVDEGLLPLDDVKL
jgi:antitoxin VapB